MIKRRDLLLARRLPPRVRSLSAETLYMRYVDARLDGSTAGLLDALAAGLRDVDELRISQPAWLAGADIAADLEPILQAFRARGGRVIHS